MVDTRNVSMGPCDCPGAPHGTDTANVKERLNFGDLRRINAASIIRDADSFGLPDAMLLWRAVDSWNKTDEKGRPLPVTLETVDELSVEQGEALLSAVSTTGIAAYLSGGPLPNPSGGPSADGPSGSTDSTT